MPPGGGVLPAAPPVAVDFQPFGFLIPATLPATLHVRRRRRMALSESEPDGTSLSISDRAQSAAEPGVGRDVNVRRGALCRGDGRARVWQRLLAGAGACVHQTNRPG